MTLALLYGASSGALHAVTGPDHLLSLGPAALEAPRSSFRLGLRWGLGHALGTLVLAIPLLLLSEIVSLHAFAGWSARLAGLALLMTAGWSFWSMRKGAGPGSVKHDERSPAVIGVVHGITGASALALVLPVLVAGQPLHTALFLGAFAIGSTLAMAALTKGIGSLGAKLDAKVILWSQRALLSLAVILGSVWLLLG